MASTEDAKTKFYKDVHALLATVPYSNKLTVRDDFSVRVRTDCAVRREVVNLHGIGGCKDDSLLLLQTCTEHRLLLTKTFCIPMHKKSTWIDLR
nr:unnamed protein product [Spirometra erinaceieuropaei]